MNPLGEASVKKESREKPDPQIAQLLQRIEALEGRTPTSEVDTELLSGKNTFTGELAQELQRWRERPFRKKHNENEFKSLREIGTALARVVTGEFKDANEAGELIQRAYKECLFQAAVVVIANSKGWAVAGEVQGAESRDDLLSVIPQKAIKEARRAVATRQTSSGNKQEQLAGAFKKTRQPSGKCFTCGSIGHWARDCKKPGGAGNGRAALNG